MTTPIRLMVVDDHTLFRRGLVSLLEADGRFEVVAEAGDTAQALQLVAACRPEVLLLDNHLPGASGVSSLPALLAACPGLHVLMLTMSEDEADLAAALKGGAAGYLLKSAESDELVEAIARTQRGESSLSAAMTPKLAAAFRLAGAAASLPAAPTAAPAPAERSGAALPGPAATPAAAAAAPPAKDALAELSARQREIAELIAGGASNKQIARTLGIAEATVKIHVQHILRKLEIGSRTQAAALVGGQRKAG